jgi:hypothetical protein
LIANSLTRSSYSLTDATAKSCKDMTLGPRHPSLVQQDRWHLVYCFAEAAHAELFREKCGGETFNPETCGRGRSWHLLHSLIICRKR